MRIDSLRNNPKSSKSTDNEMVLVVLGTRDLNDINVKIALDKGYITKFDSEQHICKRIVAENLSLRIQDIDFNLPRS